MRNAYWRRLHSGERTLPSQGRPAVRLAALARYRFAAAHCKGRRVLDIGCAAGEGLAILSREARHATGLDYSVETLRDYCAPRQGIAHSVAGDAAALPFRNRTFDAIVSFELLEHLEDPAGFLAEVRRVLTPGGCCILSTPNRPIYSPRGVWLDYHVREYDRDELLAMLGVFFSEIAIVGQAYRSMDARLDTHPLNRFFYPLKRVLDPRGVILNRFRAAYVYCRWGERAADLDENDFPVMEEAGSLPILIAVCRGGP
ncbi:MAG: class I SAM-dependent methyltransferase [Candidatus Aureabacteria bacterium]|nr:class I SAM-dependent methyltransferase [Candidatus Auribacterota bacterium]